MIIVAHPVMKLHLIVFKVWLFLEGVVFCCNNKTILLVCPYRLVWGMRWDGPWSCVKKSNNRSDLTKHTNSIYLLVSFKYSLRDHQLSSLCEMCFFLDWRLDGSIEAQGRYSTTLSNITIHHPSGLLKQKSYIKISASTHSTHYKRECSRAMEKNEWRQQ